MKVFAARCLLLMVLAIAALQMTGRAIAAPVNVSVWCTGNDIVGSRLCFAVKEAVRRSAAFKLSSKSNWSEGGYEIHVVSVDDSPKGESGWASGVAVTYVQECLATLRLGSTVYLVVSDRVSDIAESVLAELDSARSDPTCKTLKAAFDAAARAAVDATWKACHARKP